jgi:hypothetical protein
MNGVSSGFPDGDRLQMETRYGTKLAAQIEQFKDGIQDELPKAFQYWSWNYISPRLRNVFGTNIIPDIFAQLLTNGGAMHSDAPVFASLGAGDLAQEVSVAKRLRAMGMTSFRLDCYELSESLLARGQALVNSQELTENFRLIQRDLNQDQLHETYDGIMAHHSLHHLVDLEAIFDSVRANLRPGATFAVYDIVGRNGHMRWPEVLKVVKSIWGTLELTKKKNHQLDTIWEDYVNFDCSMVGFEGVRAQDILPALLSRFHFSHFVAFGGLTDVFVDRAFGHNYNPENPIDKGFIDFLEYMNCLLIDCGHMKPTIMFAGLRAEPSTQLKYEGTHTPKFCVRPPDLAEG